MAQEQDRKTPEVDLAEALFRVPPVYIWRSLTLPAAFRLVATFGVLFSASVVEAEIYITSSGSMKPTLLVGDSFGPVSATLDEVQRGDIVAFRHPVDGSVYVKRLIGMPGDTVQMKGGVLFLDGAEAPQMPAGIFEETFEKQGPMGTYPRCENDPVAEGGVCLASRFTETLPPTAAFRVGRTYDVQSIEANGAADNTEFLAVPAGQFFVLGDNRDNSLDSRFSQDIGGMGFIPAENLLGRIDLVLFSTTGALDRILKQVK